MQIKSFDSDILDIKASLTGDEDAYRRLVNRYEARISAQMWRFTRDRRELEELVQDVFVEAYLSLKSYKAAAPFEHWLRRIATRTGYRFWKKSARERQRRNILMEGDYRQTIRQEDQSPSEAAEALHKLLELLPPKDRLVLTLFYFEDLNVEEIADRTGWTRTLVKVRSHRARKKLKTLLEQAGFGGDDHGQ